MVLDKRKLQVLYTGESSRYLENMAVQFTYPAFPITTPGTNISHLKIIDHDVRQVSREAREAIHIRNNPACNNNSSGATSIHLCIRLNRCTLWQTYSK